jgi:peptidyl-tRNA hydrolase, PTH1 family
MAGYLIIGLGNIGMEYDHTRHNIGFDVVNAFAVRHGGTFTTERLADVCSMKIKGRQVTLIKPSTYMNLSGKAFKYWQDKLKVDLKDTLTIVDDLALPLEKIRLRPSGTPAGHNGLKSIQETIGTEAYPKLRFGIGSNYPKGRQVDFVLGKWRKEEEPVVAQKIDKCCDLLESFIFAGLERTMTDFNKLTFTV